MKKFNPCLTLLAVVLFLIPAGAFAQFKVSGTVSDKNGPIAGAAVVVSGTLKGTSTDAQGGYWLNIPTDQAVLKVSFIGYQTREIPITSTVTTLNITLEEDALALENVVVLGFGAATRKADLSTSVGVLSNVEKNKERPVSSVQGMLQGQIPGVTVANDGGDPTAIPSVTIRGMGSQSGESVLWVVDGVPGAPLNMNDIESLVVLKDAASAAIYGAQSGAAGVILVTTKRAKVGAPSVSYDGSVGVRQPTNLPQSLNVDQQREMRRTARAVNGANLEDSWSLPEMQKTRTDWVNEIFRNAIYQRHNVVISGGTDKFVNRVSFGYNGDEGTLQSTFNRTMSVRYSGSAKISRHITISEDFMWENNKQRGTNTNSGYSGVIWNAMSMPRSAVAYYPDGSYGGTADPGSSLVAAMHGDLINPLRILNAHTEINKKQNFSTTTNLNIHDILPGLKFNSRFTYRASDNFYKRFDPIRPEIGKPALSNTLAYNTTDFYMWETENTLTYDNTFGKHTVGALIATTASVQRQRSFGISGTGFENENEANQYLNYAKEYSLPTDSYANPDNNVALVARLSYSFNNRYFITGSWRRDYAGRLPAGRKSGDFPAVTGAWKISGEPFFKQNDVITLLKLRASWGRIGNLGSVSYGYASPTLSHINYPSDGGQVGGTPTSNRYYLSTAVNPDLTWETSEQTDIGLDVDMFRSRLSISADFFMKRTYDLIQQQTLNWPNAIGLSPMLVNQGEIRNRGFELSLTWKDQINKDWSYFVNGNFATLKNWVSDIGVKNQDGSKGVWSHSDSFRGTLQPYQTAEGESLYSYYLIKTLGLFQSDQEAAAYVDKDGNRIQPSAKAGDLKFMDYNGDGKIDTKDRQYMGSFMPKITYALSFGFTWKDLSFNMMLQGAAKTKAFNATKFTYLNEAGGQFNRSVGILKAWPASNEVPRLNSSDPNDNFNNNSDYYLEDASYLRVKNITISYDFSRLIHHSSRLKARNSSLSAFVSIENLCTITNYTGIDPEVGGIGLDQGRYPVSRVFSVGLRITY